MIELHLIGYTEDAEDLVLDLEPDGDGRYTVRIDPDLLATIAQLREVRVARGAPVDRRPEPPPAPAPAPTRVAPTNGSHPEPASTDELPAPLPPRRPPARRVAAPLPDRAATTPVSRPADAAAPSSPDAASSPDAPSSPDPTPTSGPSPSFDPSASSDPSPRAVDADDADRPEHRPAALAVPHAQLSPAAIQAQLRAGRSVRAVAAEAGTDRAWIERWLPPIIAERERVLAEARRRRLDIPRARPLGASVDRALHDRGVPEDRRTWTATRRADGRWRVSVRFEDRGRTRTATWLMDPGGERVQAASPLAEELAGPGSRSPRRR